MTKKTITTILILVAAVVVGALLAGGVFYLNKNKPSWLSGKSGANTQQAAEKAVDYINKNILLSQGLTATLVSSTEENGVIKFRLKVGQSEYDSYLTKDGKLLFPNAIDLTQQPATSSAGEGSTAAKEPEKKEKPDVKLFIMSYCPYGLQMQKVFLPVYNLLKDKADMGIYFVNYIMHQKQELDENLRQFCLEKDQKDKYFTYLDCFTKGGKSADCLTQAKVDQAKMNSCVSETDQQYDVTKNFNDKTTWLGGSYPPFNVQKDLNDKYQVQGSPTILINEVAVEVERSPEKLKEAICNAFISPPSECQQKLSETAASTGFGSASGDTGSGGGCATSTQ